MVYDGRDIHFDKVSFRTFQWYMMAGTYTWQYFVRTFQ
jgi:hypothetical protein